MELNINITEYLQRFKIRYPKSLFPPNFEMLQKNKCPICFHKLYLNRQKTMARCKQKDKFIISSSRLLALGGSLNV